VAARRRRHGPPSRPATDRYTARAARCNTSAAAVVGRCAKAEPETARRPEPGRQLCLAALALVALIGQEGLLSDRKHGGVGGRIGHSRISKSDIGEQVSLVPRSCAVTRHLAPADASWLTNQSTTRKAQCVAFGAR
jgi:hypothetical protein